MLFLFVSCLISACGITGQEVGRLSINKLSTPGSLMIKEVTLDLKKGETLLIWSEMDVEYEDDVVMQFKMDVLKNGAPFGSFEINPTDKSISLGELKKTFNRKTTWSFSGKNSELKIEEDGKYNFKAIFVSSDNPTLKVNKAEVVFKK